MDGFIVVDKPAGLTSHDVVARARRILGLKRVGHTGTLDPFATGVLPVALGEGTKTIPFLDESVKEYRATMILGVSTDTQDCTGRILSEGEWTHLSSERVMAVMAGFVGVGEQIPPMYSAIKQDGVPLYRLARKGCEVERKPRRIEIYSIAVDVVELPRVEFTVSCSRGTYVRTLAHDIGERLGCGAHLAALRRTRSGIFDLSRAVTLDELAAFHGVEELEAILISPCEALGHLPAVDLTEEDARRVRCGIFPWREGRLPFQIASLPDGSRIRLVRDGRLLAVAEKGVGNSSTPRKTSRLIRVFN